MKIKYMLCISCLMYSLSCHWHFAFGEENPSYEFLRTEIGARPAAMGGAFAGVMGDIHSLFYNPGGIAFINSRNASITYLKNVMDFNVGAGAFILPLKNAARVGIGIQYFDYGEFQGKDQYGQDIGQFGANDAAMSAGCGKILRNDIGIGVNVKYVQSKIAQYSSSAIAGDFGILYYYSDKQVTLGISALNFGKVIDAYLDTKEDLPSQLKFGITKQLAHLPLLISAEIRRFSDGDAFFNGGGEFQIGSMIRIRAGYSTVGSDQKLGIDADRWSGFSFGGGVLLHRLIIDYSLSSLGGIGSQNRFTLSTFF